MQLSRFVAFAVAGLIASTAARPIPCPDSTLDLIMLGKLPSDACCSYGTCKGHVNVSGAKGAKGLPLNIEEFSEQGKK